MSCEGQPIEGQPVEVTICPPGRRSKEIVYRAPASTDGPPVSTATALRWPEKPSLVPPARNDRRTAQERVEAALREEALSVARSQPHRASAHDTDDHVLESALGRFCLKAWPPRPSPLDGRDLNASHRSQMIEAGNRYGEIVHQHRVLIGIGGGSRGSSEGMSVALTDEQIMVNCHAAQIKRDDADAVLRRVHARAVSRMMSLCVDEMDPTPYQESLAKHCLWALAVHFAIVKLGRFSQLTGGLAS